MQAGLCWLLSPESRLGTKGDRAFAVRAPQHWSSMPENLWLVESITSFEALLKTYLWKKETYQFDLFICTHIVIYFCVSICFKFFISLLSGVNILLFLRVSVLFIYFNCMILVLSCLHRTLFDLVKHFVTLFWKVLHKYFIIIPFFYKQTSVFFFRCHTLLCL